MFMMMMQNFGNLIPLNNTRAGNEGRKVKANPKIEKAGNQCGTRSTKELHKSSNGHHVCSRFPQEQLKVVTNGVNKGQHQGAATGNCRVKKVEFASQLEVEGGKKCNEKDNDSYDSNDKA